MAKEVQTWELWFPDAAANGLLFARARIDPHEAVWIHAAPAALAVTVRDGAGQVVAQADRLERAGKRYPMTRLARAGESITRQDRWPTDGDLGEIVLLPGGEAGTLESWWNAADESEWRWRVEFYNHQ